MSQILSTVSLTWHRGFPPKSGMYLVELADDEHVVTPYQAEPRWVEADGNWDNRTGWVCLTHSRATVVAWAKIPKRHIPEDREMTDLVKRLRKPPSTGAEVMPTEAEIQAGIRAYAEWSAPNAWEFQKHRAGIYRERVLRVLQAAERVRKAVVEPERKRADEIERLTAWAEDLGKQLVEEHDEIERLRAALKQIADEPVSASASEAVMIARIAMRERGVKPPMFKPPAFCQHTLDKCECGDCTYPACDCRNAEASG